MQDRLANARVIGFFWGYWEKRDQPGFVSGETCQFLAAINYIAHGKE
jgi:hypothetical protein